MKGKTTIDKPGEESKISSSQIPFALQQKIRNQANQIQDLLAENEELKEYKRLCEKRIRQLSPGHPLPLSIQTVATPPPPPPPPEDSEKEEKLKGQIQKLTNDYYSLLKKYESCDRKRALYETRNDTLEKELKEKNRIIQSSLNKAKAVDTAIKSTSFNSNSINNNSKSNKNPDYTRLKVEYNEIVNKYNLIQKDNESLLNNLKTQTQSNEELKKYISIIEKTLQGKLIDIGKSDDKNLILMNTQYEQENNELKEENKNLHNEYINVCEERNLINEELTRITKENESLKYELSNLKSSMDYKAAEKYKSDNEKCQVKIEGFKQLVLDLNNKLKEIEPKVKERDELEVENAEMNEKINEYEIKMPELENEIENLTSVNEEISKELERYKTENSSLLEEKNELQILNEELQSNVQLKDEKITELELKFNDILNNKNSLEAENKSLLEEKNNLEELNDDLQSNIQLKDERINELEIQNKDLLKNKNSIENENSSLSDELNQIQKEYQEIINTYNNLQEKYNTTQEALTKMTESCDNLEDERDKLNNKLISLKSENKDVNNEINTLKQHVDTDIKTINSLREVNNKNNDFISKLSQFVRTNQNNYDDGIYNSIYHVDDDNILSTVFSSFLEIVNQRENKYKISINDLTLQLQQQLEKYNQLNSECDQLKSKITTNTQIVAEYTELIREKNNYENTINENERLKNLLHEFKDKETEYEENKVRIGELIQEIEEYKQQLINKDEVYSNYTTLKDSVLGIRSRFSAIHHLIFFSIQDLYNKHENDVIFKSILPQYNVNMIENRDENDLEVMENDIQNIVEIYVNTINTLIEYIVINSLCDHLTPEQVNDINSTHNDLVKQIKNLQSQLMDQQYVTSEAEKIKVLYKDADMQVNTLKSKLSILENNVVNLEKQNELYRVKYEECVNQLQSKIDEINKLKYVIANRSANQMEFSTNMQNEIENLRKEKNKLTKQKDQLIEDYARLNNEHLETVKMSTEQSELNDQLLILLQNKGEDITQLSNKYNKIKEEYNNYKMRNEAKHANLHETLNHLEEENKEKEKHLLGALYENQRLNQLAAETIKSKPKHIVNNNNNNNKRELDSYKQMQSALSFKPKYPPFKTTIYTSQHPETEDNEDEQQNVDIDINHNISSSSPSSSYSADSSSEMSPSPNININYNKPKINPKYPLYPVDITIEQYNKVPTTKPAKKLIPPQHFEVKPSSTTKYPSSHPHHNHSHKHHNVLPKDPSEFELGNDENIYPNNNSNSFTSPNRSVHLTKAGSVHVDLDNSPNSTYSSSSSEYKSNGGVVINHPLQKVIVGRNGDIKLKDRREPKKSSDMLKQRLKDVHEKLANLKYY